MKKILLIVLFIGLAAAFDPFARFPQMPDWNANVQWNNEILSWTFTFLELIKQSAYNSTGTASIYNRIFCGADRGSVVFYDCIHDTYNFAQHKRWTAISGITLEPNNLPFTDSQTKEAISFAAWNALQYVIGFLDPRFSSTINSTLTGMGYSLSNVVNTNINTASGLGNTACANVISQFYAKDRTNWKGDHPLSNNPGTPLSEYTNYHAPQDGMPTIGHTDCSQLRWIDSWQPARLRAAPGSQNSFVQVWADSQCAYMTPLAMPYPSFFRPLNQPLGENKTATYSNWIFRNTVMVNRSGSLNDTWKAIAVYYQDGEGFSQLLYQRIAATAAQIKGLSREETLKLTFLVAHAQMEADITQYDGKRFFNPPRPTTPIQCIFQGQQINAWKGPYQGVGSMDGSNWSAFLPDTLVQNSNPEFPCGHCIHSGSVAVALQSYFGSDNFIGYSRTFLPGSIYPEVKLVQGDPGWQAGVTDVPNQGPNTVGYSPANNVTLSWNTWTDLFTQAALSRTYLGVHYDDSQTITYALGQNIGSYVVNWIQQNIYENGGHH